MINRYAKILLKTDSVLIIRKDGRPRYYGLTRSSSSRIRHFLKNIDYNLNFKNISYTGKSITYEIIFMDLK